MELDGEGVFNDSNKRKAAVDNDSGLGWTSQIRHRHWVADCNPIGLK